MLTVLSFEIKDAKILGSLVLELELKVYELDNLYLCAEIYIHHFVTIHIEKPAVRLDSLRRVDSKGKKPQYHFNRASLSRIIKVLQRLLLTSFIDVELCTSITGLRVSLRFGLCRSIFCDSQTEPVNPFMDGNFTLDRAHPSK